jgi:tetratricopeptide (TPR) repeat protein
MPLDHAQRQLYVGLEKLFAQQRWAELSTAAQGASVEHPGVAEFPALAAHALRHLGHVDEGYRWARRAVQVDPSNLLALSRLGLLANLTRRFDEAFELALTQTERAPENANDAYNLATIIGNAIHAAAQARRIPEAVRALAAGIERLNHEQLHFNAACLFALAGDERAIVHARKSLEAGKHTTAFDDADFDAVRDDPRFARLLERDWAREHAALDRADLTARHGLRLDQFLDPLRVLEACEGWLSDEPEARHPEFERALATGGGPQALRVYADWLQEVGNPRGVLIDKHLAAGAATDEDERMLAYADWARWVEHHAAQFYGPFPGITGDATLATWAPGFFAELTITQAERRQAGLRRELTAVLGHPSCRFLQGLRVGDLWQGDELSYAEVIGVLCESDLPSLRRLHLQPERFDLSSTQLDSKGLARAFPDLEELVLGAGQLTLSDLDFPRLRRLAIRTGGLTRDNLAAVLATSWPALERFELWFGSPRYGAAEFEPLDLAALLAPTGFGQLRHLGLQNAAFTDDLVHDLCTARVVLQLESLDLSMGTMTDAGALELATNAARFAHLTTLNLAANSLTAVGVGLLREALPLAECSNQKAERYVSVGE